MKQSAKRVSRQMNLPLLDVPVSPAVPADKQRELTLTLVELLIKVVQEPCPAPNSGGEND
jgi:hypothetical protein